MHSIQIGGEHYPHAQPTCSHALWSSQRARPLCGRAFFLPVLERVTVQVFSPKQYVLFYQHILLAALLTALVCALSHIERIPLSAQALGLSLRIPRERKNFVLPYVALMALAGLSISLFLGYFKYKGVPIHQLVVPLPVELLSLRAADGPGKHLLAMLPYAISVLVLAPIVEEIYFTRIVFPALRNRLGLVAGACYRIYFCAVSPERQRAVRRNMGAFVIAGADHLLHSTVRARSTPSSPARAAQLYRLFGFSALY